MASSAMGDMSPAFLPAGRKQLFLDGPCGRDNMRLHIYAGLLILLVSHVSVAQEMTLVRDGTSPFTIVISSSASLSERRGAKELQSYLWHMSGAQLPIVTDLQRLGDHAILVGRSRHTDALHVNVDVRSLGPEGFVLQ